MQLYYIESAKYKVPSPAETGATLKYDIQELRLKPGKLTKRYEDREAEENAPHADDQRKK